MPTAPLPACLEPRCPGRAVHRGYCARHRRSTTQRGYGITHQRARELLAATLPAPCGYCGRQLRAGDTWVAAHWIDGDPSAGWMVACPVCNERAKGTGGGVGLRRASDRPLADPRGPFRARPGIADPVRGLGPCR